MVWVISKSDDVIYEQSLISIIQVQKAQIEKAEIKADMTKERLELSQDLLLERERARNLEETVRLLKEQAEIYQVEFFTNMRSNFDKTFP